MKVNIAIEPLGEAGLLVRLGQDIEPDCNRHVHQMVAHLAGAAPVWLVDLVPAYASLAVVLDLDAFDADPATGVTAPLTQAETWLRTRLAQPSGSTPATACLEPLVIPVCYGGEHGPDLNAVAEATGLGAEEVITRHCAGDYCVAMLGFAPGFPYLLGLDPALALPRLATPRTRVPAGSVGIGGAQTGIYPRESPGGWRLIGRTPMRLFDPSREPPAQLAPGQRIGFVSISVEQFEARHRGRP